jgi:hypothetical protein
MPTSRLRRPPPWPDLLDIADRLHVPTDYVRLHAVCKPWCDAIPPAHCRPAFLPWLVAPRDAAGHRKVCCVSSKSSSPHRTADTEVFSSKIVLCVEDKWLVEPATPPSTTTHGTA